MQLADSDALVTGQRYTAMFQPDSSIGVVPSDSTIVSRLSPETNSVMGDIAIVDQGALFGFFESEIDVSYVYQAFGDTAGEVGQTMATNMSSGLYGQFNYLGTKTTAPNAPGLFGSGGAPTSIVPPKTNWTVWIGAAAVGLLIVGYAFASGLGRGVGEGVAA